MIAPALSNQAFLDDVARAREETGTFHLWWLGQSGFLIQWEGRYALIDPYLSDSLTKKYAGTDKPHVRMVERVVAPEKLDFIDVVSSSHNHTDHLDGETLIPLMEANPELTLIMPEANRQFAADRLQVDPSIFVGLDDGESAAAAGFTFHALPAAHEQLEQDEKGRYTHLGYVVEFGPWTVYHSGDTVWYDGLVEKLAPFDIDAALLPINGQDPARGVPGNFDGREAAELANQIGARLVIPCHFEMFAFNSVSPDEFIAAAEALEQPYYVMRPGERYSF